MNREDIEQWTREAGGFDATPEFLAKFAALVASAERNRCVARADIALLGADITLRDRVLKSINIMGQA